VKADISVLSRYWKLQNFADLQYLKSQLILSVVFLDI